MKQQNMFDSDSKPPSGDMSTKSVFASKRPAIERLQVLKLSTFGFAVICLIEALNCIMHVVMKPGSPMDLMGFVNHRAPMEMFAAYIIGIVAAVTVRWWSGRALQRLDYMDFRVTERVRRQAAQKPEVIRAEIASIQTTIEHLKRRQDGLVDRLQQRIAGHN